MSDIIATHSESAYPELWDGCVGAWCPSLGATGGMLFDHTSAVRHGTLTSFVLTSAWLPNQGRIGLKFDNSNDHVTLGTLSGREFLSAGASFSISWWEYIESGSAINPGRIFLSVLNTAANGFLILRSGSSSYNSVVWGGADVGLSKRAAGSPSIASSVGIWRHWVVIGDAGPTSTTSSDYRCFADGVEYAVTDGGAYDTTTNTSNRFGYPGLTDAANCWMDDIRIYRRAMRAAEVRELYRLGPGAAYQMKRRRRTAEQIAVTAGGPLLESKLLRGNLIGGRLVG